LISGGAQASAGANTVAGRGLTLDNTGETTPGVILDATAGGANLTFYLGYGATSNASNNTGNWTFDKPETNSSYVTIVGNVTGELAFTSGDVITVDDLTGGNLQFNLAHPYLLIQAGSDSDYSGIMTTGGLDQDGWVTNLTLTGTAASEYSSLKLYLSDGDLEVVPEPGTWALMLGGFVLLVFLRHRKGKKA
jgi:hypothetical protein